MVKIVLVAMTCVASVYCPKVVMTRPGHSAGYYELRRECAKDWECRWRVYGYFNVTEV